MLSNHTFRYHLHQKCSILNNCFDWLAGLRNSFMIPHTSVPWDGDIFMATFSLWFLVLYFLGGLENKGQEVALRKNPDIIVATPGRLVDHLRNTPSFSLQNIEILVLDEADRYVCVWGGELCI